MATVIGIDLGTFNSCVSVFHEGVPEVIANTGGYKVTPSMVAVTASGRRLTGHIAKRQAVTNAENTVYAAKRLIGRSWDSPQVQRAVKSYPYRIVHGPNNEVRIALGDREHKVSEISAMLLMELRQIAEKHLGHEVERAVITVPAYFNDGQRQATRDAGRIAGLDVIRIINEPTAAALAYGFGKNINRRVAIYDLGGGTFDISLLEISSDGVFRVLATGGDTFLGGEDFDQSLVDWLADAFDENYGVSIHEDRMALQRLRDAVEKAKCDLSVLQQTEINLPFLISNQDGDPLHLQVDVPRHVFEALCEPLVHRTLQICEDLLAAANLKPADFQDVILVGGMTRMPAVQRAVKGFFDREPCKGVHPDEVVALGAAIQGAALEDVSSEVVLLDVTPHRLGIMTTGRNFEELVAANTTIPTTRSKTFTTNHDGQTAVRILVMQGTSVDTKDTALLGEFVLTGLRAAKKGEVEVEVTFEIDADGIVSVLAADRETGLQQSITVTASSGLTEEEIEVLIAEAEDFAVARKETEAEQQARHRLRTQLSEAKRLLPTVEALVAESGFGGDSLAQARGVMEHAALIAPRGQVEELEEITQALERTVRMFKVLSGQVP